MIKKLFYIVFVFLLIPSCNEYQKLLRSEDIKIKYQKAENYFENEEFRRASGLFEQILPKYRGKPQAERITFFYAKSLLEIKNYVLAAYQFESFIKAYPISQKVEEAAFLRLIVFINNHQNSVWIKNKLLKPLISCKIL